MMHVTDIRRQFAMKFMNKEFEKNGTLEILGASFFADEDSIFGKPNVKYQHAELDWYKSQSLNVNDLQKYYGKVPVIWKEHAASKDGWINSNYGWMIYSKENGSQYDNAIKKLKEDRNTRQASMIYTRPSMHHDWDYQGKSDFCCTNAVTYYIKKDEFGYDNVHACVQMRSNDAVFGYLNDFYWQYEVLSDVAYDLGISQGDIFWQAQSLHVYERHFHHVEEYCKKYLIGMK